MPRRLLPFLPESILLGRIRASGGGGWRGYGGCAFYCPRSARRDTKFNFEEGGSDDPFFLGGEILRSGKGHSGFGGTLVNSALYGCQYLVT